MRKILLIILGLFLIVPSGTALAQVRDCNTIDDFIEKSTCIADRVASDFSTGHAPAFCSADSVRNDNRTLSSFCSAPTCTKFERIQSDGASITAVEEFTGESELNKYQQYCEESSTLQNQVADSQAQKLKEVLEDSGSCVGLTADDATTCPNDLDASKQNFIDLQRRILAGEIVAINEEPIGTENVFTRMRACTTSFVRDLGGHLQSFRPDNADGSPRYAVEIANCRNYIVDTCTPTFTNVNTKISLDQIDTLEPAIYCDQVQIFTGNGGVDLLKTYVRFIYTWAAGFIGIVSVFVILLSGIQLSASGGDSEVLAKAKTRIIQSLSALAILFMSGLILYVINPTFFVSSNLQEPPAATDDSGTDPNNN